MPKISILIPVYNAANFLRETIDSVLCQTFTDFELLVMDDASTDHSAEIIHSYKDTRIKYFACPHDFVGTLNRGLELAKGKYIALLDHDDVMIPQRLQIQYDFMEDHLDVSACGGYMYSFGRYSKIFEAPLSHDELITQMIVSNPMLNPTGCIRREILTSNQIRYQTGYSYAADYKFWFEVSKVGKLQTIPKTNIFTMKPITVIIPIYNAEDFLQETIDNVLCQTFSDFELLALDDGSTDKSPEIIQSYTDSRVKYIPCSHDFIATLNKGLALSKSKYVALVDHDDIMMPYRLKTQYEFMESNPDIAACGGYMHSFGFHAGEMKVPLEHRKIIQTMLLFSPILNPTGFIRRSILHENHIQYERGYSFSTDYKLWSEIAKVGKLATVPKVLTLYRLHDKQTSIRHNAQCLEGGRKVKEEMLDYFLSHLKEGDEFADEIDKYFIHAINDLGAMGVFSEDVFFQFMYEMVGGLLAQGIIEI